MVSQVFEPVWPSEDQVHIEKEQIEWVHYAVYMDYHIPPARWMIPYKSVPHYDKPNLKNIQGHTGGMSWDQYGKDHFGGTSWDEYEKLYPSELVNTVKEVDASLPINRLGKVDVLASGQPPGIWKTVSLGTMRVFDGSIRPESKGDPRTPMERMFEKRGVDVPEIEALRRSSPHLFEIGKFILQKGLSPEIRTQTRDSIEYWLLHRFVDVYTDAVYVIHTASPTLRQHFEVEYGFTLLREITPPGSTKPEYLMKVSQSVLKQHLEKRTEAYNDYFNDGFLSDPGQ
ncbi:MAG: hypothetical protein HY074_12185 [Deltaproteobacteria bacterium]|nr:hypothetical protein [Deltaproteobacteria bacterium]